MHTEKLDQGPTPVIGYTREGQPVFAIAGGNDGAPASNVDAAVAALTASAGQQEGAAPATPPSDPTEAPPPGATGAGDEPTGDPGSQPSPGTEPQPTGQELIAPYLEGLDGSVRDTVSERLERFRQETDRNANSKIQSLSEQLKGFQKFTDDPEQLAPVVDLYAWLMQEPEAALPWIVEALHTERGVDLDTLKDPLMEKLGIQQPPSGSNGAQEQPESGATDEAGKPLTRADLEAFTREQEQARERQVQEEQQREQAAQQLNNWTDEALEKFGLKDRVPEDSPMRQFIYQQAHGLMQSRKVLNGQMAIETATEQVKQFLDTQAPKGTDTPSPAGEGNGQGPRVANGGTAPQAPDGVDLSDSKQRKEAAAAMLASAMSQE